MRVGDYVRTKDGKIINIQVLQIIKDINCDYVEINYEKILRNNIVKSSPNIIDLIEVGDYVNGEQVSRIKQCPEYHLGDGILIFNEHNETIYSNFRTSKYYDITSIVTKEQFESMEYKVGE